MASIQNGSVGDLLRAADVGPFMRAEIISLAGRGKLRVNCNWFYSALNCDPNDNSTFLWQFDKLDDQHISLSPVNSCIGQTIYASVREDFYYHVHVQPPYSPTWITSVARDETIGFVLHDLSIAQFSGFNGKYIAINDYEDSRDSHAGFRVRSVGTVFDLYSQWFIAVAGSLQSNLRFSGQDNSLEGMQRQLSRCNISLEPHLVERMVSSLASPES